ncbi:hypothetical protein OHA21_09560 [Actinoplanes sp. NBC_00393]|uniref:hypothetical protein n=1 Tax=Actinoplanes sp. NBC_00393 TaxID=2975953 RepID=UPI002E1B470D
MTNSYQKEYGLRLRVSALRREVFEQNDPASEQSLLDELTTAERALSKLDQSQSTDDDPAELENQPLGGRIIDTAAAQTEALVHEVSGEATTGLDARAVLRMAQVPTSIYHLFDRDANPLVTCTVRNASKAIRRLRISSFVEGYSGRAIDTVEIEPNQTATVDQLPTLFHHRVRDLTELTAASVNMLIEDLDGKVELHSTRALPLLARTTAPLAIRDPATGKWSDVTKYFGAFVTPNAPTLMQFLRVVAEQLPDPRMVGYLGSDDEVVAQVEAIFGALKNTGIIYVNSVVSFSPEEGAAMQRVRLPRETLKDREANCIDGTVLVASLLEGISMNPAIVIVPGHALVGWQNRPDADTWSYLETTMIGTSTFAEARESAEKMVATYRDLATATSNPALFRQWSLSDLRTEHGITPME